jgi:hypothetical protein
MPDEEPNDIKFSVKDLLVALDTKMDHMNEKLDTKAAQAELQLLKDRQLIVETRQGDYTRFRTSQDVFNNKTEASLQLLADDALRLKTVVNTFKWLWSAVGITFITSVVAIVVHWR